jgi:hypothetical protein
LIQRRGVREKEEEKGGGEGGEGRGRERKKSEGGRKRGKKGKFQCTLCVISLIISLIMEYI